MDNLTFRNLFLTGTPGVGKTYFAKQILDKAIKDRDEYIKSLGHDGYGIRSGSEAYRFFTCSELMLYARIPRETIQYYETCVKLKGLILDDLGMGKKSDFIPDIIYMIIDARITLNRPTIVTTNLKLEEISTLIDDRLASRLGSFEYLKLEGEDKRLKKP